MAQIDLKYATMLVRDGYTGSAGNGAIANAVGYPAGATVLTVDGFIGAVTTGDYVTIGGSTSDGQALIYHKITAHTETTGNTTSITVTPALGAAVLDNAVITALPHQVEIKIGEGNLTYAEKRNMQYVRDRGRLDKVREGDEDPVEVKFDFIWEFIKADTGKTPTIEDCLKKRGNASTWISTSPDLCEPYSVDIYVYYNTPCATDDDEQITLQFFRYEELAHDLKAASVAVTGKCNVKEASVVRL